MTKKAPGMFAVVFSRAAHALGSPRPWTLYRLAKHWAIPSSSWLIPGLGRGVAGTSAPPVQVEIRLQQDSQLKTEMRWPLQGQCAED